MRRRTLRLLCSLLKLLVSPCSAPLLLAACFAVNVAVLLCKLLWRRSLVSFCFCGYFICTAARFVVSVLLLVLLCFRGKLHVLLSLFVVISLPFLSVTLFGVGMVGVWNVFSFPV